MNYNYYKVKGNMADSEDNFYLIFKVRKNDLSDYSRIVSFIGDKYGACVIREYDEIDFNNAVTEFTFLLDARKSFKIVARHDIIEGDKK